MRHACVLAVFGGLLAGCGQDQRQGDAGACASLVSSGGGGMVRASSGAEITPIDVSMRDVRSGRVRLLGVLGRPFGKIMTLQGMVLEGPFKGWGGGDNLLVQSIDGVATQEDLMIPLREAWGCTFGEKKLPKLVRGKSYEFEGFERVQQVGSSLEYLDRENLSIQTCGLYLQSYLLVFEGTEIPPVKYAPADFADRVALLEGHAVSEGGKAFIEGEGWRLLTDEASVWPSHMEGKLVESYGTIRATQADGGWCLEGGWTRLVRLEDQIGREVMLRGMPGSMHSEWWFTYRGTRLLVHGMEKLPGWEPRLHGTPVVIRGTLEELPRDGIGSEVSSSLIERWGAPPRFIVRNPQWEKLSDLLWPERLVTE